MVAGKCMEWSKCRDKDGYGLTSDGIKTVRAHRLAYCEARGMDLNEIRGLCVRHKCDNPPCVNPEHLEIGTNAENQADKRIRGRSAKGSKHGRSLLTESDVVDIRRRYKKRCPVNGRKALSIEYGVDEMVIGRITSRETWKHVP